VNNPTSAKKAPLCSTQQLVVSAWINAWPYQVHEQMPLTSTLVDVNAQYACRQHCTHCLLHAVSSALSRSSHSSGDSLSSEMLDMSRYACNTPARSSSWQVSEHREQLSKAARHQQQPLQQRSLQFWVVQHRCLHLPMCKPRRANCFLLLMHKWLFCGEKQHSEVAITQHEPRGCYLCR